MNDDGRFNPADHTVDEVQEYLNGADDDEKARVLDLERQGDARVGIIGHEGDKATTTKAQTFSDAAAAAQPHEVGYTGFSPEAERTGRRDKGLSQRNPAILNGGPVPDVRVGVDDSEALDALTQEG